MDDNPATNENEMPSIGMNGQNLFSQPGATDPTVPVLANRTCALLPFRAPQLPPAAQVPNEDETASKGKKKPSDEELDQLENNMRNAILEAAREHIPLLDGMIRARERRIKVAGFVKELVMSTKKAAEAAPCVERNLRALNSIASANWLEGQNWFVNKEVLESDLNQPAAQLKLRDVPDWLVDLVIDCSLDPE